MNDIKSGIKSVLKYSIILIQTLLPLELQHQFLNFRLWSKFFNPKLILLILIYLIE